LDDILYNKNNNKEYEDKTAYIIQYPKGNLSVSYGILRTKLSKNNFNFNHLCSTENGSSGSPIQNLNNKVIGIHTQGGKENINKNKGTFLNYPIKEFIKKFCKDNYNVINNNLNENENLIKEINMKYKLEIKEELILEGQNKTNELIDIYNEKSTKISDEINQILKQLEGHKEKLNLTEFMSFFEKMGKEEEKLNLINKNIIKIHLSSQINDKIYSIMNKIEQIMNETYGDENNLFNLSPNFNMELSGVLKRIKKKEFNENIVRPKKKTSKKRKSDYYHDFNEEE
jgi:hypothetical protein